MAVPVFQHLEEIDNYLKGNVPFPETFVLKEIVYRLCAVSPPEALLSIRPNAELTLTYMSLRSNKKVLVSAHMTGRIPVVTGVSFVEES